MTLQDLAKMVELERFLMGMGKYEFAQFLGMKYHTYQSFIMQRRDTRPCKVMVIINFLKEKGKDVSQFHL